MTAVRTATWTLLSSLKRAQLQRIATSVGAPLTGTKSQLVTGIQDVLTETERRIPSKKSGRKGKPPAEKLRVLSIDMGIRNLAFAFLTCEEVRSPDGRNPEQVFTKPELSRWRRIQLFSVDDNFEKNDERKKKTKEKCSSKTALLEEPEADSGGAEESYEPPVLAKHAYAFSKYCASLEPTHILIERQRFRSGGHASVQEWSLRVGMLESMLHATFHTLKQEKLLSDTAIESVLPIRVNKFWFADRGDLLSTHGAAAGEGSQSKRTKVAKIKMVSEMLDNLDADDGPFSTEPRLEPMVEAFRSKLDRTAGGGGGGKTKTSTSTSLEKLDDVSDALLQGLAWLKWQANRRNLLASPPILATD